MTRNKVAASLAGLAMVWLCSPAAAAQSGSLAPQAQENAPKSPVQVAKTAAPAGSGAWEVTLTVKGGGTQVPTQPIDLVLLLDCSPGMTAQLDTAKQASPVRGTLPKQAAQTFFAAAQAHTNDDTFSRSVPRTAPHARKGTLFSAASSSAAGGNDAAQNGGESSGNSEAQATPASTQPNRTLGTARPTLPAEHLTRIGACKRGAEEFLSALAQAGVPARIGVVAYAGTATVLLPLTPLDGTAEQSADSNTTISSFLPDTTNVRAANAVVAEDKPAVDAAASGGTAAVKNAVGNLWQTAYSPNDLCYGNGRGVNLEQAFVTASTLLKGSRAAGKYIVVIGGAQPGAYGADEQSCLVPESDPAYAPESKIAAATRAAAQALQEGAASRVFTVGVGTNGLSAYASRGAAYTVQNTQAAAPLREIAALLCQRVQGPAVNDNAGDGLVIDPASAVCTPASTGVGAQPYVTVAPDGKSLYWSLGACLPNGEAATLRYTLKVADEAYSAKGIDLQLGSATLVYSTPLENGALQNAGVSFAAPTVHYATGVLRVYSSGLPAQLGGTAQVVGPAPVTDTAFFSVQKPAEHAGWRIDSVIVNGETRTPAQFAEQTEYRLPVKEGVTVVEYRYVPAPTPAPQWSYTVQYYRDGLLLPDASYTGSVPAAAPVVESVPSRLDSLPGCAENPVRTGPFTLTQDGQVLRVDYLTQPREGAQLTVRHLYTDGNGTQLGMHTTAPATDAPRYNVRDLFSPGYGGSVYMPTLATLTLTTADGTQAQQENVLLASSFSCAQGERATLTIHYVPLRLDQTVPQGTPGAGSNAGSSPAASAAASVAPAASAAANP